LHPGDFLFREVLVVVTIAVLGLPIAGYFLHRLITPFFSYYTHANIRLPDWIDHVLGAGDPQHAQSASSPRAPVDESQRSEQPVFVGPSV
jgi:sterol desaturase/sphingolipid hydroxylase (fatty acid hydroxylase superfamily)